MESDWEDRIVEAVKNDRKFAKKMNKLAELDATLFPIGGSFVSGKDIKKALEKEKKLGREFDDLCYELAKEIANADEDPHEIGSWLGHKIKSVLMRIEGIR